jgi:type IV secretion system protein VirB4
MTTKWLGAAAWSAKEAHAGERLPYARLVDEHTLLLRDGSLMGALQVPACCSRPKTPMRSMRTRSRAK